MRRAVREGTGEALTGGSAGRELSREKYVTPGRRRFEVVRKATSAAPQSRGAAESRAVEDPGTHGRTLHGNREIPCLPETSWLGTHREVQGQKPMMNEPGKSDRSIVPKKSPNKAGRPAAEGVEGRDWPRGTGDSKTRSGRRAGKTCPVRWSGYGKQQGRDKETRFTALFHHVYDLEMLRWAYLR